MKSQEVMSNKSIIITFSVTAECRKTWHEQMNKSVRVGLRTDSLTAGKSVLLICGFKTVFSYPDFI
jgi:hypothetical protein